MMSQSLRPQPVCFKLSCVLARVLVAVDLFPWFVLVGLGHSLGSNISNIINGEMYGGGLCLCKMAGTACGIECQQRELYSL